VVQSTGTKIENFFIPPFTVDRGEVLIIQLPNGPYFTDLLFKLRDILTGNEKNESVNLKEKFKFVDHIKESRWQTLIFPLTVKRYIRQYANPDNEVANKIYEFEGIRPNTKISRLAGNPRKLLSLLTTSSWTDKIVFDLAGVDPVGGQRAYELVKSQIGKSGAAVLIDYCDDFKDDCSQLVKFELVSGGN
jgi:hypothetical protein